MPDTEIERTIYKLEIDGSAYVDGVDKTTAATKKLSEAQEAANQKLAELKTQQASYKKELETVNAVLKANEKETLELNKRYNELKDRTNAIKTTLSQMKAEFKGNSIEAKRLQTELKTLNAEEKTLQAQMRGLAVNSKEYRAEQVALKSSLAQTTTAVKVQTKEIVAAEAATGNFTKGLTKAYSGLRVLANIIPGVGIAGLVTLIAGPLVDAITAWVTGLDKANSALRLMQANQANANEVMAEASKAAGKQITDLKILYETATNVNISIEERRKAVEALQREFPDYFGNIKAETILNGKAEDQYKALTLSILATARATAAKGKLDELAAQQLEKDFERQKVINATNQELAKAQATKGGGTGVVGGLGVSTPNQGITAEQAKEIIRQRRDLRLAQIAEDKKQLQAQEDFLIKFAGLTNIANVTDAEKKAAEEAAKKAEEARKKAAQNATKKGTAKNPVAQQNDDIEKENERLQRLLAYNLEVFRNWQKNILAESKSQSEKEKAEQEAMQAEYEKTLNEEQKAFHAFIVAKNKEWDKDPERKKRIDEVLQYANAVQNVAASVISFWQAANDAEQKALERSIDLQETRVEAAQRIADRGNAEYLKAETDRLNELSVARENAARKQLGIDAALQASQILVGITGAISKIATPGIGAAQTIAEIAIIIGALATGYGLVKSLQGNQPRLFKGTKYLDRDGAPAGKDTIPVMANEGEAVIPTDTNREYHPAVSAIYDRTIPAEDLNKFVTTYHKIKPVPGPNYDRIGQAAILHLERDGKMSVLLSENNKKLDEHIELQKMTLQAMKKMNVSASIDRDGVAIMVNEFMQKLERDKRL